MKITNVRQESPNTFTLTDDHISIDADDDRDNAENDTWADEPGYAAPTDRSGVSFSIPASTTTVTAPALANATTVPSVHTGGYVSGKSYVTNDELSPSVDFTSDEDSD